MNDEELDLRVGTTDGTDPDRCTVIDARSLPGDDGLAALRRGMSTAVTLIVPPGPASSGQIAAVTDLVPPELRVELLLCNAEPSSTERLDMLAWPWSMVAGTADRGSTLDVAGWLDAATAQAGDELVAVSCADPSGDQAAPFRHLVESLGVMWVHGADALVVDASHLDPDAPVSSADGGDNRIDQLALGLGLRRGAGPRLVVLRRWVARFLLDEISRAIDPVVELAARIRLLELRLVVVREARR